MGPFVRHATQVASLLAGHGPSGAIAIVIAELLFKFHSFTLEAIAFLATWYVADVILERPVRVIRATARRAIARAGS